MLTLKSSLTFDIFLISHLVLPGANIKWTPNLSSSGMSFENKAAAVVCC